MIFPYLSPFVESYHCDYPFVAGTLTIFGISKVEVYQVYQKTLLVRPPPSDVCWFINPSKYSYLRIIRHYLDGLL